MRKSDFLDFRIFSRKFVISGSRMYVWLYVCMYVKELKIPKIGPNWHKRGRGLGLTFPKSRFSAISP